MKTFKISYKYDTSRTQSQFVIVSADTARKALNKALSEGLKGIYSDYWVHEVAVHEVAVHAVAVHVVTCTNKGAKFWLKGTTWAFSIDRADKFCSGHAAGMAIAKARKFMTSAIYKTVIIESI
jgi:hypothetical protein